MIEAACVDCARIGESIRAWRCKPEPLECMKFIYGLRTAIYTIHANIPRLECRANFSYQSPF
jgi:hypothetical protein